MTLAPAAGTPALGVVLLAAGRSARMGKPKLLLPWGGTSVLGHLIRQWQSLGAAQLSVVCAAGDSALAAELERLGFPAENRILNPAPERGMFSSLQCAARWRGWRAEVTRWAVALGDQPQVRLQTLRQVLEFSAAHPARICQPARRGRGRHPVLLPEAVFRQLATAAAPTLRDFLAAHPEGVVFCESDDPGLDLDIDRPEDYEQALRLGGLSP